MITKPMLAGTVKDMAKIQYPVLCTPKLDGIRCLKIDGKAVSRNFKKIPNTYIRSWIEEFFPDGVDGELIAEGGTFQETTSAVMREDGARKVVFYYVFDYVKNDVKRTYSERMEDLADHLEGVPKEMCKRVLPTTIKNETELLAFEKKCLADGYEGVMLRRPDGPYKEGRSTVREGYLLKLKRFVDSEAVIVGFEERLHNENVATKDAFGRTERSSHKANMTPTGMLGAFVVKEGKMSFKIGSGFTEKQRIEIWNNRDKYLGQLAKYKSQKQGSKDAPRFPIFLGVRNKNDC
ncbi:hypothetical protein LCGC14_2125500 [marine sediment metagenome]|uniref:ATP-dependent DNA ligase family profile domain-containing protein n=1 Tax=marine sediment metagenome TaxID=412755 RepID=A0A0F9E2Y3_9ZZZZ